MSIHVKTAIDHIRRTPFQAVSAFFVLTITFFVVTLISITLYSTEKVLSYFETRPQIIAFLRDDAPSEAVGTLETSLKNDSRVSGVTFISKEEALEIYKEATADNPLLSELVSPSTFPASLEVSVSDIQFAEEVIESIKGNVVIEQVGFTASLGGEDSLESVVNKLKNISWYIRIGGVAFSVVLVGTSFLVLIVIIGMRLTTRRGEMEVLKLIGATPAFIRKPIVLEAIFYAVSGVLVGWFFAFLVLLYAAPTLISYFGEIEIFPRDTVNLLKLFGVILLFELAIGLVLAFTGSVLAVSRTRKK